MSFLDDFFTGNTGPAGPAGAQGPAGPSFMAQPAIVAGDPAEVVVFGTSHVAARTVTRVDLISGQDLTASDTDYAVWQLFLYTEAGSTGSALVTGQTSITAGTGDWAVGKVAWTWIPGGGGLVIPAGGYVLAEWTAQGAGVAINTGNAWRAS